jgi:DNA helicase-2/ATP-dependent DNA helicase PcrA
MDFLHDLNESQKEAVLTTEGPVRVIAGPGTGKTKTLTSRYCYMVNNLGIAPNNIFAMTFTNKAADEMKTRVREALGDADLGVISTIHSFCRLLLRDEIHILSFPQNFTILDSSDQKILLKKIFSDLLLSSKDLTIKEASDNILEARKITHKSYIDKFFLLNNEELKNAFLDKMATRDDRIFLRYLYEQKKNFALDFNDLINFAIYILEKHSHVREKWQRRAEYVMIDEFQDVSQKQYKIGKILSDYHKNIFIVGDSDQTIYSWRSAHYKLFLDFHLDYENSKTIILTDNYRSTPEILKLADASIGHNSYRYSKELIATLPLGPRPLYHHAAEVMEEGKWIAERIKELTDNTNNAAQTPESLKNIAILCRSHLLAKNIELSLFNASIPFKHINGRAFFARKEIKDALSHLRMLTNSDDLAFIRIINTPPRGIGKKSLEKIKNFSEKHNISYYAALKRLLPIDNSLKQKTQNFVYVIDNLKKDRLIMDVDNLFQSVLDRTGYEEMIRVSGDQESLDSLAELKRNISDFTKDPENTLEDFLDRAALTTAVDHEKTQDAVSIMTVHTAKGLEFNCVFVCGLNEGIFPSRRVETLEDMEEERRIFYVSVTRAKHRLFLSSAEGYNIDSVSSTKVPSRFLSEVVDFLDGSISKDKQILKERQKEKPRTLPLATENLLKTGDKVKHFAFGAGEILEVNYNENSYLIKFDSLTTPRSITFGTKLQEY